MEEYNNILYFANLNVIGGVESCFYYIAKKYSNIADITVFYRNGDIKQLQRLRKLVRVKKFNNQKIKCKKLFVNYTLDILDYVEAEEKIEIIHGDLKAMGKPPKLDPRIDRYVGVSQRVCDSFKELTGTDCELCYNPIEIDRPKKMLKLISLTRLTKEKGKNRMKKLASILDANEIPFEWDVYTNDSAKIDNPNIFYKEPTLDVASRIIEYDYLVQLSDHEAFCYSAIEALILRSSGYFNEMSCI